MSDITGTGHGSAHDWKNLGTSPFKVTEYSCRKCGAFFRHCYGDTPRIFEAMKQQSIPVECAPNVKLTGSPLTEGENSNDK